MGVSRNITIQVYSDIVNPYQFLKTFLVGFWIEKESSKVSMFYKDETDDDVLPYEIGFNKCRNLILRRFKKQKVNTLSFSVSKLNEGIILSLQKLKNEYSDDMLYEIWISPGGTNTLTKFDRNTDFSFYLNKILPRLQSIDCQIWEIKCQDIG